MRTLRPGLTLVLLGALLATSAPTVAQAPDTLLHSLFGGFWLGWGVAADGNTVVASAPGSNYSVKVFDAMTGALLHTLTNGGLTADGFGGTDNGVAISGSRVVVGAFLGYAGTAFVYDLASGAPTVPVVVLTNPSPQQADQFGFSVAISGARVAVGAPYDDTGADGAGIAYVYDLTSPTPALPVLTLTNPNPSHAASFGNDLALSGDRLAVGGFSDNNVYVYDLASATPAVPVVTLSNPPPAYVSDRFGSHVDISGTRVIIGAYEENTGSGKGTAYVYDLASATPTVPVLTLTNPMPAVGSFGYSVSIGGTRAVVGYLNNADRVYVYELASATPTIPIATLQNPTPAADDRYGSVVAIAGANVVVGAAWDDTKGGNAGAAYVFGPRPALSIGRAAPGSARVSWAPATTSGFRLQYKNSITSGQWVNAPSGETNPVTIRLTNAARIYRLAQP